MAGIKPVTFVTATQQKLTTIIKYNKDTYNCNINAVLQNYKSLMSDALQLGKTFRKNLFTLLLVSNYLTLYIDTVHKVINGLFPIYFQTYPVVYFNLKVFCSSFRKSIYYG